MKLAKDGVWFLLANELFFALVSVSLIIIGFCDILLSGYIYLLAFLILWYVVFYRSKNWLHFQIQKTNIKKKYENATSNNLNIILGFILFVGSYLLFIWAVIYNFQGRLIN